MPLKAVSLPEPTLEVGLNLAREVFHMKRARTKFPMLGLTLLAALAVSVLVWKHRAPKPPYPPATRGATLVANSFVPAPETIPHYGYKIIKSYPHDPRAFTQGLVYNEGYLYESTGLYGQSSLRKVEIETGKVLKLKRIPSQYFAEGLTLWRDQLILLTWRSRVGFVYDLKSFEKRKQFSYSTEGWGLTHNGRYLIMSDGTDTLYFLHPETFQVVKRIQVQDRGVAVDSLNELEYVKGEIYANVWQTEKIARISPETGKVVGWIDLEGLLKPEELSQPVDVLNGIAYDAKRDRLFVTGKLWPKLFEIEVVPLKSSRIQ